MYYTFELSFVKTSKGDAKLNTKWLRNVCLLFYLMKRVIYLGGKCCVLCVVIVILGGEVVSRRGPLAHCQALSVDM